MRRFTLVAGATLAAVALGAGTAPAQAAPRPPAPAAQTTELRLPNFDPLPPSSTPVALRDAYRDLKVTYTFNGQQRTLQDYLTLTNTHGFVVLDGQDVVFEKYAYSTRDTLFQSWSMAKSFTSAAVGIALSDGKISSIEDPVTKYVPELRGSGYDGVSLKNLLAMSSGIQWNEGVDVPPVHVAASLGIALPDLAKQRKRGWEPGSRFEYTSMNSFVLGWAVAKATGTPFHKFVAERIWKPAGMADRAYLGSDSRGNSMAYCCTYATGRDFARFGLLYLNGGRANGQQVVPQSWVTESTRPSAPFNKGYGLHWWLGEDGDFMAQGLGGQTIYVSPKTGVVIAKTTLFTVLGADETGAAFRAVAEEVARTRAAARPAA
ncbi:serine hydrolase domain-containing protein [Actinomadura flavalba]|uniref:serine hydrolase domain-containing protein n=1 Tax=Actinomadura flavalba TaxID=1120938 RepID=UPI0003755FA2|nr:serine hydrolase domain-containing protein [Actinomadura flavalba]